MKELKRIGQRIKREIARKYEIIDAVVVDPEATRVRDRVARQRSEINGLYYALKSIERVTGQIHI